MESPKERAPRVLALHHVAMQTNNLDRAIYFYVDVLGGTLVERTRFKRREMAWIALGGIKVELFSKRDGETLQEWSDYYSGPVHLALVIEDLDAFIAHAASMGVPLHPSHPQPFVPPVDRPVRIAYLRGPDGEEVELRSWKET
jgi:catechol 2,3-dioxygenase-like lactoylglutathione lyase family enzyme